MTGLCRQHRQYDAVSIAAGSQVKIEECGDPATEVVAVNGELHDMCGRCAGDAVKEYGAVEVHQTQERDAASLREYAAVTRSWGQTMLHRPALAAWFAECALLIEAAAGDILEGRA